MAFTPASGPVIDEPLRPRALWYWLGGALILGGVVGAIVWIVMGVTSLDDKIDGFERVPADTGGSFTIDDPGKQVIYAEASDRTFSTTAVPGTFTGTVLDPEGGEVPTSAYTSSVTYDFSGRSGTAAATFTAAEAGEYEIEPGESSLSDVESYVVGPSIAGDLVATILGAFAIGGLGFALGLILLIVTGVRRSRAKKRRNPPPTGPPPSHWGQAPQTWGPQAGQPHPPQPGWGQQPPPAQPQPGWSPQPGGAAPPQQPPPPPGWPSS